MLAGLPRWKAGTPFTFESLTAFYRTHGAGLFARYRVFLDGSRVNNVLLYSDSGRGKSATVKTLLSVPGVEGLRLIEIQKDGLRDMSGLIRSLAGRPQRFILFIDDLAFDQDDHIYSVVKIILEGGLEKRPRNVAIYATSNRRLLVRQTFSDRFGLRIPYLAIPKGELLDLIEQMVRQREMAIDPAELRRRAVQWDMRFPG